MLRLGVDLGGTKIEATVLDEAGKALSRQRIPTPQDGYAAIIEAIGELVDKIERELGISCRIGVGTPGAISPRNGLIKNANSTCLNDRPLQSDLSARLGREVRLANDANCLALSESFDGAAVNSKVVFAVILGTGVGGGLVINGQLIHGANAIAGEWGHNPLPEPRDYERPGPACYCGRRGCLETFLSGPGLMLDFIGDGGVAEDVEGIVAQAGAGNPTAQATIERYVDRLSRGLASVVNILDPDVIVLGGGVSNIPGLCAKVSASWDQYVFSNEIDTVLTTARHGDSSGVRGAARLWRD
ncbi:ROK family protein [Acidihalobacter prosperus]